VGIDTATPGTKSGTATITLTSAGAGTSGLSDTLLAPKTINVQAQVNNFAVANVTKLSGNGTLNTTGANDFTLNLGSTMQGLGSLSAELGVSNDGAAPADELAGSFTPSAPAFTFAGFGSFTSLAGGSTHAGLMIQLTSATIGSFVGQITFQPQSTNPQPFSMNLSPITIHLLGTVRILGDYNGNGTVDAADYVIWRDTLGQSGNGLVADGNGNDRIDDGDYDVWRSHFGTGSGAAASAGTLPTGVPEPTAVAIFGMGVLLLMVRVGRYSSSTQSDTSPSLSISMWITLARQQTGQSSTYSCRSPCDTSMGITISSPQAPQT
jgi:hypothetical protein